MAKEHGPRVVVEDLGMKSVFTSDERSWEGPAIEVSNVQKRNNQSAVEIPTKNPKLQLQLSSHNESLGPTVNPLTFDLQCTKSRK